MFLKRCLNHRLFTTRSFNNSLRHVKKISDLNRTEFLDLILFGHSFKLSHDDNRKMQTNILKDKILLMFFSKPSLRTRLSLEIAMHELGGKAIYYDLQGQNMGKKESIYDTAKVVSRYVDGITIRTESKQTVDELAQHATVPVINALDDYAHPCQILADFVTILEYFHRPFNQITMTYIGDVDNNVTYDLMRAAAMTGMKMRVCGPKGDEWSVNENIKNEINNLFNEYQDVPSEIIYTNDPIEAITGTDIVYTDTWMSYHISANEQEKRMNVLKPYQVTKELMSHANDESIFMHCLPAGRGHEVTDDVMDSSQSVVFDQAENRLHAQKALLAWLIGNVDKLKV